MGAFIMIYLNSPLGKEILCLIARNNRDTGHNHKINSAGFWANNNLLSPKKRKISFQLNNNKFYRLNRVT